MAISQAERCRRRFLHFFPRGFADPKYVDWEREYKDEAHRRWNEQLSQATFDALLNERNWPEIVTRAIRIEARTNLLFSFEKMAMRDAVKTADGAQLLAAGLYQFLYGDRPDDVRFAEWCDTVGRLPRHGTRVSTWPVVTVFGFLAQPKRHVFLKPNVTRAAALRYGFDFTYRSRPEWDVYKNLLDFAALLRRDLRDLGPRDMIDLQSFMWVQGSEEYAGRTFKSALTTRVARNRRSGTDPSAHVRTT